MLMREQDKHFLLSIFMAMGVIFVWKGLWEGIYEIPHIGNEWVILFIGFAVLTFSGLIFREFDPLGNLEKSIRKAIFQVKNDPKKHQFKIKYYDKNKKKHLTIEAKHVDSIEKGSMIIKQDGKEVFIPLHRIEEIVRGGKTHWRL